MRTGPLGHCTGQEVGGKGIQRMMGSRDGDQVRELICQ